MLANSHTFTFNSPKGFLVLEGVNGAGKSTLQKNIGQILKQHGIECILTREPGGTLIGNKIRELLLNNEHEKLSAITEIFLFSADRSEHMNKTILPAIASQKIVISDRYYYSTLAFQGYGRGFDIEVINQISKIATKNTEPDLVILLDLDPEIGLERTRRNRSEKDKFEEEDLHFQERMRDGFLNIAKTSPTPFLVIDVPMPQDKILANITPILQNFAQKLISKHG